MSHRIITLLLALSSCVAIAADADVVQTPLSADHPLVGTWRIELPEQKCFEEYMLRADGTKSSRSAEERNEAIFNISLEPSSKGFYKWIDKITKSNFMPDCSGSKIELNHVSVMYVRMHPSKQKYLLCEAEDMKSCFAEFNRQK